MLRGSGTLAEKQEAMRQKYLAEQQEARRVKQEAQICVSCRRRQARRGSAFCSRCSATGMVENLRDTLPGIVVDDPAVKYDESLDEQIERLATEVKEVMPNATTTSGPQQSAVTGDHGAVKTSDVPNRYTRRQVVGMLGISTTTLSRWEKKGATPQPIRVAHNNQCFYTEEMVKEIRDYKEREYILPAPSTQAIPGTPNAASPRQVGKALKINKRIERAVANRIISIGKRGIL